MITFIRSTLFNLYFYGLTALLSIVLLPCLLYRGANRQWLPKAWIAVMLWGCNMIAGLRYRIKGNSHRLRQPSLLAAKHQSAWETMVLYYHTPKPCFILKKELLSIPVFGWYLRWVGSIAIDRSRGKEAIPHMLEQAAQRIADGYTIIIFPEGTRRAPGASPKYRSGIIKLYEHLNAPVQLVAHNAGCFWGRNAYLKKAGEITLHYLPAIEAGLDSQAMFEKMQTDIEAAANSLL